MDFKKIDYHSHVLPGIDDGAKNIEESVKILDMMADAGVDVLFCTPHFYPHKQSLERFLDKRNEAFETLKPYIKPQHPEIRLGAEVLLSKSLSKEELELLKLDGTDYVLIEMPYVHFSQSIYDSLFEVADTDGVKVLIAHIERYLANNSLDEVEELFAEDNAIGQINCTSLRKFGLRRNCVKLIRHGCVQALGSDYHRIERGYALLDEGLKILRKKLKENEFSALMQSSQMLLENKEIEEVMAL